MTADYVAVLDANVLVGNSIRDTLLRLAETPRLYIPKWSEDIIGEVQSTLDRKYNIPEKRRDYLVARMRESFPEAWVTGYADLIPSLKNEPKDRHVLAAAIRAGAQSIVTFNLRDFPDAALEPYGIEAVHPDEFLVDQFYLDDALVVMKLTEQAANIDRTLEELLGKFHQTRALPNFAQTVAAALSISL